MFKRWVSLNWSGIQDFPMWSLPLAARESASLPACVNVTVAGWHQWLYIYGARGVTLLAEPPSLSVRKQQWLPVDDVLSKNRWILTVTVSLLLPAVFLMENCQVAGGGSLLVFLIKTFFGLCLFFVFFLPLFWRQKLQLAFRSWETQINTQIVYLWLLFSWI